MKLCRVAIRNCHCIESIEFAPSTFTSLIGPNNSGKSSALRALEVFLNQSAPAPDEWRSGHEGERSPR